MPPTANEDRRRGGPWTALFLLWLLGFTLMLSVDPAADPPLGPSALEGQLLLHARAAVDSSVPTGVWNPGLISPTQMQATEWAFRLFDVSLASARMVTTVAAILAVSLFFGLVRRMAGPRVALLAAVLLTMNPIFFAVCRTALPAVFSIFGMLAVIRLWLWSDRSVLAAFLSGAGLVWVSLAENGPDNAFFLGAGILAAVLVRLHAWKMPWLAVTRRRLGAFWAGAGVALAGFVIQMLRRWDEFGATWSHFKSFDLHLVAVNTVMAPLYLSKLIQRMPIISGLALVFFLFFAKETVGPVARHRRMDETRLWFLGWIIVGTGYFTLTAAPPLNALVLLVPPMCFLAAKCLSNLLWLRKFSRPRMDVMIVSLLLAGSAWFGSAWLVHAFYGRLGWTGFWEEHVIRGTLLLVILLWLLVSALLITAYLEWKHFTIQLRPLPTVVVTVVLLGGILGLGGHRLYEWWIHRTYDVRDTKDALGAVLDHDALVVGSWAPLVTLGTAARGTLVWPGVNDHGQPWIEEVTHLLLAEGNEHREDTPPLSTFRDLGRSIERVPPVTRVGSARLHLYRLER